MWERSHSFGSAELVRARDMEVGSCHAGGWRIAVSHRIWESEVVSAPEGRRELERFGLAL